MAGTDPEAEADHEMLKESEKTNNFFNTVPNIYKIKKRMYDFIISETHTHTIDL